MRGRLAPLVRSLSVPSAVRAVVHAQVPPGLLGPVLLVLALLVPVLAGAPSGAGHQVAAAAVVAGLLTLVVAARVAGTLRLRMLVPGPPADDAPQPTPAWVVTRVPRTPRRPRAPGGRLPR